MGIIDPGQYLVFFAIAALLMISPGPAVVLAITNGMLHGHRRAVYAILGNMTGFVAISVIGVIGLDMILSASAWIYGFVKWVGGLYLIYLGFKLWRTHRERVGVSEQIGVVRDLTPIQLYWRGFMVTFCNPKAIAFVVALLPQFLDRQQPIFSQSLLLIGTLIALQGLMLNIYAWLSSRIRHWLNTPGRLDAFNKLSGATFMGFGVSLFFSEQ